LAERRKIFDRVWTLVRDRYVYTDYRGLDWQAVREATRPRALDAATTEEFYAVLRDMIERLGDEHSRFESPRVAAEDQARTEGVWIYSGIGVNIRDDAVGGLITRLAPGGPAEQAGLQPHDLILAIAGVAFTDTLAFGDGGPNAAVRGAPGTPVRLTVRSPGGRPREVVIVRQVIPDDAFPPTEAQRLPGSNVGVLAINTFERENLAELVGAKLESLLADGPLDGLILDMRENGGGFIGTMLDTLALFVDGSSIGTSSSRTAQDDLMIPAGRAVEPLVGVPIVVLTSDETVSAAEMFAAGIQALGRARVVGTPSAGNTENLLLHTFAGGSRLWLAEFVYRLPNGDALEGRGVQPDRLVVAVWWRYDLADDPQVRAAIDELHIAAPAP
jgi:C-terminal peptidase prc